MQRSSEADSGPVSEARQKELQREQGVGFDSNTVKIPKIEQKIKSDHKRGWGLQLIKELMDTVEFESSSEGTTVTMTKKK